MSVTYNRLSAELQTILHQAKSYAQDDVQTLKDSSSAYMEDTLACMENGEITEREYSDLNKILLQIYEIVQSIFNKADCEALVDRVKVKPKDLPTFTELAAPALPAASQSRGYPHPKKVTYMPRRDGSFQPGTSS